jgi:hypothetical protein
MSSGRVGRALNSMPCLAAGVGVSRRRVYAGSPASSKGGDALPRASARASPIRSRPAPRRG